MTDPTLAIAEPVAAFLAASPATGWTREALACDASGRRYERLRSADGRTAILMDSRGEPASLAPFLQIGAHLRSLGLAAPNVLAQGSGLLLLEDLGRSHMTAWLDRHPAEAPLLYGAAVEILVRLQGAPPPEGLIALSPTRAAGMIAPLWEHYAPELDPRRCAEITGILCHILDRCAPDASVLALRDFHAENLVWRPEHQGTDRLGLLDFQDAVLAPPEYDLASLLRDARRDTDPELRAAMMRRFADLTGRDEERVAAATAVLGLQRNLRILGIFARLARERGKTGYLSLLPRVWGHVLGDLSHPALRELAPLVRSVVPPPPGVV